MSDYKNAVVYKIYCKDDNIEEVYIGSTTNFKARIRQHKCCCYNEDSKKNNIFLYQFMRQNGGFDNFNIEIIEYCDVSDKKGLHEREKYHILLNEHKLNKIITGRTQKEYYENNKVKILQQQKEYNNTNKEKIKQYNKEYHEKNKEKVQDYININKEKIKQYQKEYRKEYEEKNKEKIKQRKKEYFEKNKEKLTQKFTCKCGGNYTHTNKVKHENTNKHKQYIQSII